MGYHIVSTMPGVYRVMDGLTVVGMAMRCTNKQWVMTDVEGATIGRRRFPSAKAAAEAMEAMRVRDASQPTGQGDGQ